MTLSAIEQGYFVTGTKSAFQAYQHWCQTQKHPLIYAKKRGQRVQVEMDLIWCEQRQHFTTDPLFRAKVQHIHDQVCAPMSLMSIGLFTHIE